MEPLHVTSFHFDLLQLFKRILQRCCAETIQTSFVDYITSPDFLSAWRCEENDWIFNFCVNFPVMFWHHQGTRIICSMPHQLEQTNKMLAVNKCLMSTCPQPLYHLWIMSHRLSVNKSFKHYLTKADWARNGPTPQQYNDTELQVKATNIEHN